MILSFFFKKSPRSHKCNTAIKINLKTNHNQKSSQETPTAPMSLPYSTQQKHRQIKTACKEGDQVVGMIHDLFLV